MNTNLSSPSLWKSIQFAISFVPASNRRPWIGLVVLSIIVSGMEMVAAVGVFWLIQTLTDPRNIDTLIILGRPVAPYLRSTGIADPIVTLGLLVGVFYLAKNVFAVFVVYRQSTVPFKSGAEFSRRLFTAYMHTSYAYHLGKNSAEIQRNVGQAVDAVFRSVLFSLVTLLSECLVVAGLMAVLFVFAPLTTLAAIVALGAITYFIYRSVHGRADRWGREILALNKEMLQTVGQSLGGLKEIRVLGRETFFVDEFARQRSRHAHLYVLFNTAQQLPRLTLETSFVGLIVLVLVASKLGFDHSDNGGGILALLGLYGYVGFRIMPSLNRILVGIQNIRFGGGAVQTLYEDLERLKKIGIETRAANPVPLGFETEIRLRGVSYTYPNADRPSLSDINLVIPRGISLGIVGSTGAGKSTLLDVILGLLEPDTGDLLLDGAKISDSLDQWRRLIGYVPQQVFLLDDTLAHNIALGQSDAEIDRIRIATVIRSAQLEDVVKALPHGIDTIIGERGVRLSGGQRQRVAIARALYHERQILVLDEATAALDNRTELYLSEAIKSLSETMTVITVAHRLNTVRHCQRIIVMKDGAIADSGTYDELVAGSSAFLDMAALATESKE